MFGHCGSCTALLMISSLDVFAVCWGLISNGCDACWGLDLVCTRWHVSRVRFVLIRRLLVVERRTTDARSFVKYQFAPAHWSLADSLWFLPILAVLRSSLQSFVSSDDPYLS
jgi:hypothetical protein